MRAQPAVALQGRVTAPLVRALKPAPRAVPKNRAKRRRQAAPVRGRSAANSVPERALPLGPMLEPGLMRAPMLEPRPELLAERMLESGLMLMLGRTPASVSEPVPVAEQKREPGQSSGLGW